MGEPANTARDDWHHLLGCTLGENLEFFLTVKGKGTKIDRKKSNPKEVAKETPVGWEGQGVKGEGGSFTTPEKKGSRPYLSKQQGQEQTKERRRISKGGRPIEVKEWLASRGEYCSVKRVNGRSALQKR